jgi:LmbE family N-acetylglucosaminyl deacetylase
VEETKVNRTILPSAKAQIALVSLLTILALPAGRAAERNGYPLPEERGTAGILADLQMLPVHARVLYTIAHPDDENSGALVWLSRKAHARTALFSLTRGDGGQNVLGTEKYEAMGLVRTGELLEASKLYGVELYFGTVFEFGFSKSADETLSKWGREATLEELVRFIRMWRPDVIISRFGVPAGGHGHHQAAGIVTTDAYRAAADPKSFPAHLEAGLQPWQARKLFYDSGSGGRTVSIPVGSYDPVLGRSYREIGAEGYSKHRSQGNGARWSPPGGGDTQLRLVDASVQTSVSGAGIFDSIDTSLPGILKLGGAARQLLTPLEPHLNKAQAAAEEALRRFQPLQPGSSASAVAEGVGELKSALQKLEDMRIEGAARQAVADALQHKLDDFNNALNSVLGIYMTAYAGAATASPGQNSQVTVTFYNRGSEPLDLQQVILDLPKGWPAPPAPAAAPEKLTPGTSAQRRFSITIPANAAVTEPFWYREDTDDNRYKTRSTANVFAPFAPPVVSARGTYRYAGAEIQVTAPALAEAGGPLRGADFVDFQIVPSISVTLTPDAAIVPLSQAAQNREFQVSILNNIPTGSTGSVRLEVPAEWGVEPAQIPFTTSRKGESVTLRFAVRIPPGTRAGKNPVAAVATVGTHQFRRGYRVISYPENWTRHLYSPARSSVEILDIKVDPQLTVGYIMGAGDEVPPALEQLGAKVEMVTENDLAYGDLSGFSAIVVGIRAYNVNEALKAHNQRLLRYVEQGGTLVVQYNTPVSGGPGSGRSSSFPYGPYPMSNSAGDRITVEESPITILHRDHALLNEPNRITPADFEGWVQERGLYFMSEWDPRYTALLSGHDPGEEPKNGGLLVARYGKGLYIYTAYAWFRQLPAGVPGAFRIFANLISAQ